MFPALALGEELVRERPDSEVLYIGTRYGFEAKWFPNRGYRYELFDVHGLMGGRGAMARAKSISNWTSDRSFARDAKEIRCGPRCNRWRIRLGADGSGGDFIESAAYPDGAKCYTGFFQPDAMAIRGQDLRWFRGCRCYFNRAKVIVTGNPIRYRPRPDRNENRAIVFKSLF